MNIINPVNEICCETYTHPTKSCFAGWVSSLENYANFMQGMKVLGTATSLVKVSGAVSTARCFEPVAGAALEDEVTEVYELVFVLGVAAPGHEVGEDDDVVGEVIVTVAVFPDFELDVDVASEVAEGCADAVPVAHYIIS